MSYLGMGFFSWGWVGRILGGGSIFLRGGVKFFSPKRGVKGWVKFFFAKNVKNLPVLSDFNGFLAVLTVFNGF